jgi:hypothetical protein
MLASLDRCPHGRHQYDVCVMCVGDRLPNDRLDNLAGYGLDGHSITVRDIYDAWRSEQSVGTR